MCVCVCVCVTQQTWADTLWARVTHTKIRKVSVTTCVPEHFILVTSERAHL
jgi:hypothetical protein